MMEKPLYFAVPILSYDEKDNDIRVFGGVYPVQFDRRWSLKRVTATLEGRVKTSAENLQNKIWATGFVLFKDFGDSLPAKWVDKPYTLAYVEGKGYLTNDARQTVKFGKGRVVIVSSNLVAKGA